MPKHVYHVAHIDPKGDVKDYTVKADDFYIEGGFHHFTVEDGTGGYEVVHSFKSDHVHRVEKRTPRAKAPAKSAPADEISEDQA